MKNVNYFRPNLKQFFTEKEILNYKKKWEKVDKKAKPKQKVLLVIP
jgi:hypothetical protein